MFGTPLLALLIKLVYNLVLKYKLWNKAMSNNYCVKNPIKKL